MNFDNSGTQAKRAAQVIQQAACRSTAPHRSKPALERANGKTRQSPDRRCKTGRRQPRSRFFAMLSDEQMRACEMIARGFHLRTAGLGARTQSFTWQPKSTGASEDRQLDLMRRFTVWAAAVQREGLSLAAVLDIVVFGKSCRSVDKARKKRNGFARAHLLASLDLYGKI